MEWIDYRELPPSAGGFSQLFYDYLYDFNEVKQFYPHNFRDWNAYEAIMQRIDARPSNRATVARALREQNKAFGSPSITLEQISLLEEPQTYAVVTGQQVGLFGGPMYTILKTITVIKLAEMLKQHYPQNNFVPVFWIEGEDHDFAEMNNISVLNAENTCVKIEYLPNGQLPEKNLGPIGELVFDGALSQTFAHLEEALQKTEFTQDIIKTLKDSYNEGRTFNQSFAALMNSLFEDYGLVFISSNHHDLKKLIAPLFLREISDFPKTSQLVIDQSAELEKGYHAQVKPRSLNLFLFHKGGRYLITPREEDFSLKGTRHFLQKDELIKIAEDTPELLSPNVILRPIVQDTLLPTVAYVAGPSEIAYHAQLKPLYEYFGVPQPVIYPRASSSFVEERLLRAMDKYQLSMTEFLNDIDKVTAKVAEQISSVKLDKIFSGTGAAVQSSLNELKFGLKEIDPTLLGSLETVRSKFDHNLSVLKEKAVAAQKRRNDSAVRQVEKAAQGLLPNGGLQERELSILYYMNKYGPDLVKSLFSEIDLGTLKHQIIRL